MILQRSIKHIHFIAICGTAMGSLAAMLKSRGYHITGSDDHVYPPMSTFLHDQGIEIFKGFDPAHLEPVPDLVIIGNAMSRGNPEVETVLEQKIPYTSMAMALKEFFIAGKHSVVVAGTHGKTTTSSLIAWILDHAGKSPGFLIGGIPQNFGRGFQVGDGDIFVVEGDEYDTAFFDKAAKFFHYLPEVVVLNNIEFDHADIYDNLDQIKLAFRRLVNLIPRNGLLVAGAENEHVAELMAFAFSPVETFGLDTSFLWHIANVRYENSHTICDIIYGDQRFGTFEFSLCGEHNIRNVLAATAVCHFYGLSAADIAAGLRTFRSVKKRLEVRAVVNDVIILDDFAHHPTAVKLTIEGVKRSYLNRRVWAVYEPRTATAKRKIMEQQYVQAFDNADKVVLAPLHLPNKVKPEERMSVEHVATMLNERHVDAVCLPGVAEIVDYLADRVTPGDVLLIMSNGAFGGIHDLLMERLSKTNDGSEKE